VQVISARVEGWIPTLTGLSVRQFGKLVWIVGSRVGDRSVPGRPWGLPLVDRVLLVAVCYRTNLTYRQVGLLFGISKSAAGRIVDHLAPHLVLSPVGRRRRGPDQVLIVDGTLVPTHDRSVAASSKNYRYSTNLQIVINADTRLAVAVGEPQPGNRNDCKAFTASGVDEQCAQMAVMGDGGYQGTRVITPFRKPTGAKELPTWQEAINAIHRRHPRQSRTRHRRHEKLEHPAQLPTQTKRRLLHHRRRGAHAQPDIDHRLTPAETGNPTQPTQQDQLRDNF